MPKKIFRIGDNSDPFANVKLKDLPREADGIKNMTFNEWGRLCKRAGYVKWNTTSLSDTHKIVGLHRFYKQTESSKYCLVVCDTTIKVLAEAAGHAAGSSLKTVTTNSDAYFIDFVDRCLIANGAQNLMKFNGTVIYNVGITAPTAPTGVGAETGSLSAGNYMFKVTYVDENGNESNPSVASAAIVAELNHSITVTIPVYSGTDYKIAKRNIYRTLVGGASYYYDGQVNDNTTLTFSSTQSDTALVQANSLENYHEENHDSPPAAPTLIAKRGGRIYLGVGKELYYSKRFYEYFPSDFWIPVGNMRNITGIINQLHTLQVATKNSVERLLGTSAQIESAEYFQFKDSYSSKGVVATRSVVDCDNYIIFLNKDGLYVLNIDKVSELNIVLNEYLKTNMNQTYIDKSCACFYDGKYILSYPKGSNTVPTETVFYDFRNGAYGIFDFAFNVYSVWGQDGEDSLKAGSTTVGRVYDVFNGLDDDGNAIEAYDTLPYLYFGNPDTFKQIYNFYIKIKSTTITTATTVDADSAAAQKVLSVAATTNFSVGESVVINEGGVREEIKVIDTIQSGVSLTMTANLTYAHTATQADIIGTPLRFYYQLDEESGIGTETYKIVTLTADKTKWYKIDLAGGGQRCRGIKLRPCISDKYYWEIQGIHIIYRDENPLWGEE